MPPLRFQYQTSTDPSLRQTEAEGRLEVERRGESDSQFVSRHPDPIASGGENIAKKSGLRNAPAGHKAKGPSGKGRANASRKK